MDKKSGRIEQGCYHPVHPYPILFILSDVFGNFSVRSVRSAVESRNVFVL